MCTVRMPRTESLTAHPKLKGKKLQELKGEKGFPFGKEIMEQATEGKISEVTYWWPLPDFGQGARKAHLLHEGWRSNLRRRLLQVDLRLEPQTADDELPMGRLVVSLSRHFAAVIDGLLHDNHDCSRDGTKCVYGFWRFNSASA